MSLALNTLHNMVLKLACFATALDFVKEFTLEIEYCTLNIVQETHSENHSPVAFLNGQFL